MTGRKSDWEALKLEKITETRVFPHDELVAVVGGVVKADPQVRNTTRRRAELDRARGARVRGAAFEIPKTNCATAGIHSASFFKNKYGDEASVESKGAPPQRRD